MNWSVGFRFLVVGVLALLMCIPLMMVTEVIESRASYSRATIAEVSREWGGAQAIVGPQLVIPVEGRVTKLERRKTINRETGEQEFEMESVTRIAAKKPVFIFPEKFDVSLKSLTEERKRGIFKVPVYRADLMMDFDFAISEDALRVKDDETVLWDQAYVIVSLSSNRALRGPALLTRDGLAKKLEPAVQSDGQRGGISARIGDPRGAKAYQMKLSINGAQNMKIAPVGRTSRVTMASDWPHPSFTGAFLPNRSESSEAGFRAEWEIPHLARAVPQISRTDRADLALSEAFGVRFYQPNDFYQKAYRIAAYGVLFTALTFLTVLLIERAGKTAVHPVQYVMIGLAQSTFVLLMISFAEQIGFEPAYAIASVATVLLLTIFGFQALGFGKRTWALGAMLTGLYAVMYLILRSTEYTLMAGSILAFAALAATMYATRNEVWYGTSTQGKGPGWFTWRKPVPSSAPSEPSS